MIRRMSILLIFLVAFTSATSFSLSDRPTLKYGTAWKKEATADLVFKAVIHGFRRQCIVVMFELYSLTLFVMQPTQIIKHVFVHTSTSQT